MNMANELNILRVNDIVGGAQVVVYARGDCVQFKDVHGDCITVRRSDEGTATPWGRIIGEIRAARPGISFHWEL